MQVKAHSAILDTLGEEGEGGMPGPSLFINLLCKPMSGSWANYLAWPNPGHCDVSEAVEEKSVKNLYPHVTPFVDISGYVQGRHPDPAWILGLQNSRPYTEESMERCLKCTLSLLTVYICITYIVQCIPINLNYICRYNMVSWYYDWTTNYWTTNVQSVVVRSLYRCYYWRADQALATKYIQARFFDSLQCPEKVN